MEGKDVAQVKILLNQYLKRFGLVQTFTEEEVSHYFCSDASKSVVWSYVVEHEGKITDFASFYSLEVRKFYVCLNERLLLTMI